MIKPDFWADEKLATRTSRDARLLYIALWNFSDDYAVVKGHPRWLQGQVFPYETIPAKMFDGWLKELEDFNRVLPFEVSGELYYYIPNFTVHQVIDRPSKQRNPEPPPDVLDRARAIAEEQQESYQSKEMAPTPEPAQEFDTPLARRVIAYAQHCPDWLVDAAKDARWWCEKIEWADQFTSINLAHEIDGWETWIEQELRKKKKRINGNYPKNWKSSLLNRMKKAVEFNEGRGNGQAQQKGNRGFTGTDSIKDFGVD